jgi:hypothetical protein
MQRRIGIVLDAITLPPARVVMLEALARAPAREAASRFRDILAQPNVVGVGIAEKRRRGRHTGQLSLTFYVERKHDVTGPEAVPEVVPRTLVPGDIPTDVVELGRLVPEELIQNDPIEPGFSIGHPDITAGTLGALIGPRARPRIISNSHVLANSGLAQIGDPIVYPGDMDGGTQPADVIARLTQVVPFEGSGELINRMDAAAATVVAARRGDLRSRIATLGVVPTGTTLPRRGLRIEKVGRTTGHTKGVIEDINFRFALDYGAPVGEVGFIDQVLCSRYTRGGDSGSLVLERDTNKAVGLHFAGANGGSVFSPIRPILRALHGRLIRAAIGEA